MPPRKKQNKSHLIYSLMTMARWGLFCAVLLRCYTFKTCWALTTGEQQLLQSPAGTICSAAEDPSSEAEGPWGLTTFANIPYVACLSPNKHPKYDIAVLGAPFDTATTGRPGARFGPRGIRAGSWRINPAEAWSVYTGENVFCRGARIVDCGDVPLTWLDNTVALRQLEDAHRMVGSRQPASSTLSPFPRIITLGGDHTTSLFALRAAFKKWGKVAVIHFDAHIDTWEPKVLGGDLSEYAGLNHGTFLHIAHEEGLISNKSIHAGIRAPLSRPIKDMKNDRRCGFDSLTARAIDQIGVQGIVDKIKNRVGDRYVYISVDIDVLDPAFAPATGTAEPGGWSSRELLSVLDALAGLKVIGADVVEVAPAYDNPGETTTLAAAEVVQSIMYLMLKSPLVSPDSGKV